MSLAEQKHALRREMRAKREQLTPDFVERAAHAALVNLQSTLEWQRAERVALFAAFAGEIPTYPVFLEARRAGKRVSFPRMETASDGSSPLSFVEIENWDDLHVGRWGVLEPSTQLRAHELDPSTLVLVPGLAFDRQGHRLGMGKGYYDRTLAALALPLRFGFAFEFQLVAEVPSDSMDQKVVAIVTERAVHRVCESDSVECR